jgi:hypothetical protein
VTPVAVHLSASVPAGLLVLGALLVVPRRRVVVAVATALVFAGAGGDGAHA